MPWLQLIVETDPDHASRVEELLLVAGAVSASLEDGADQPLFEPPPGTTPLWSSTRVVGLFPAGAELAALEAELDALPGGAPPWRVEVLEDRDWSRAWMDDFKPMSFGRRLWVVPSGFEAPDPDGVNLQLDPGLAFGTGTHPTTALCLEWLDAHPPSGLKVIDYGCGSGILALAALLLGAERVLGVDNDPQALIASRDNAERNGVAERLRTCGPEGVPEEPADLMLANILAGPLIELAPRLAALTRPGGGLVLSGILASQAEAVAAAYAPWFTMEPPVLRAAQGGGAGAAEVWVRLDGRKR